MGPGAAGEAMPPAGGWPTMLAKSSVGPGPAAPPAQVESWWISGGQGKGGGG